MTVLTKERRLGCTEREGPDKLTLVSGHGMPDSDGKATD